MEKQSLARGLETRIANKHKRRDHIVACAGKIIAEDGLEAFTIARLAEQADVTIPTVHNLLGKRADILDTLVDETMSEVMAAATDLILRHHCGGGNFINGLTSLLRQMSLCIAPRSLQGMDKLFRTPVSHRDCGPGRNQARLICKNAVALGKLEGRIDEEQVATRLFSSQRLARLDWMHGYIDLETYRIQVLTGMLITLCADAAPDFKEELLAKINALK